MNEVESNAVVNPDVVEENVQDNTNKATLTGNIEDYKLIVNLTKEMKSSLNDARETVNNSLKKEGYVVPDVLEDMVLLTSDDIETCDVNKLLTYLEEHSVDKDKFEEKFIKATEDDIRNAVRDIRKTFRFVHNIEREYHNIINESKDILEEYFNYINSTRVEDSLKKRLEIMKSIEEVSENKDPKNQRMINTLEKTLNLSFITENIDVDRIVDVFFKDNLSAYVIKKFKSKITKYGYNEDIYIHFFDLEETFLEEKYHPFNNLFLFIYMRYVGSTDPYNKNDGLYVRSITGSIANLIYHRFDSTDHEKEFVKFISSILDKFIDAEYTDRFIMDNVSYKYNESNIRARAVMEEQKRDLVTRKLKYYGIEYSDDMSLDELMKLFDDSYNALEDKVLEEESDDEDDTIEKIEDHFKVDEINAAIDNIKGVESEEESEDDYDEEELDEEDTEDERSEDEQDEAEYESTEESECDGSEYQPEQSEQL